MDYADLIARLRAAPTTSEVDPDQCADAITELQARVAELTDELQTDQLAMHQAQSDLAAARATLEDIASGEIGINLCIKYATAALKDAK